MSNNSKEETNITFFLDYESELCEQKFDINDILKELENAEFNDDFKVSQMIDYQENYTVKELLTICDYYGFAKDLKTNKCNKEEIIHFLVNFESTPINNNIVIKRKNMWFYMNELKNDKIMKKYVLW
jgi:DNA integrity scanning protein DisA with diadenylate cyclase activity